MNFIKGYLIPRLLQYFIVTFLGLSAIFFLPRLLPTDPVKQQLQQYQTFGVYIPPEQQEEMMRTLRQLYGLEGTLWEQYLDFWKRLLTGDFGPSFSRFPVSVSKVISQALPWTVGLLSLTTILSWIIAVIVGGIVGYYRKRWMEALDVVVMIIRPIPYYVMALICLILFAYVFPIFPLSGGIGIGQKLSFDLETILSIVKHGTLPALTLMIVGIAWQFQSMKLIVQIVKSEDHVWYAKTAGVTEKMIVRNHVIRNAMLPMITQLGLQFGGIFSGALITEMVFAYPGIGWILYDAIMKADYNLIMGVMCISTIAITTSILLLDLIYPLFDPRVRYR
ncbi:ABC transporter permease [Thermotoga maritima MSB8]|uniref:Oligopeptide ABC transporter, permease protein n=1 Tax=Thermotoga maritima (strain ATCC 43589 / DSM 3109 / JCM 10099 / NBRC 100826 / MSB8) TaxID=243274 RepID=Q9X0S5_THEMA|nr:ABC transporter permease [Thermotoga maritima]AAD36273.1 oligopeptide ABC transporter, permease protein [Thermotoga maritima MSB8]AGL50129.1 Dipeptide transport system permease protein DppB [Thermotoga maritima MSB8]AHD18895.1 ABC transporter permease [Thermotoga maritima MSB8]AKE27109.1 ABC transporter permease [Thermotoga maritima]AKE28974.1 ABC transporter permease [Thermotoga maritima MSB8]